MIFFRKILEGRTNRKDFLIYNGIICTLYLVIGIPVYMFLGNSFLMMLSFLLIPVSFFINARRLNDIGYGISAAFFIMLFNFIGSFISPGIVNLAVYVINFIIFIYLCLAKSRNV